MQDEMFPVVILAKYHSSARSAVSECPDWNVRFVSQCPNSKLNARLVFERSHSRTAKYMC